MAKRLSLRAANRSAQFRQAYVLIILGGVSLMLALLLRPDTGRYPVGVLVLGGGMLVAAFFNPYRLIVAGWLTTLLGLAVFLVFKGYIGGGVAFPIYIIAIGLALLVIAIMARRGYVRAGAITPGLLVTGVGVIEYLLVTNRLPDQFLPFI